MIRLSQYRKNIISKGFAFIIQHFNIEPHILFDIRCSNNSKAKATLSAIALAIESVFWLYLGSAGSENSNFLQTDNRLNFLALC